VEVSGSGWFSPVLIEKSNWKKSFFFFFFVRLSVLSFCSIHWIYFFEANIRIFDGVLFVREVMTFYEGPIREEPCSPSPKLG
jgi:hypothetical protein